MLTGVVRLSIAILSSFVMVWNHTYHFPAWLNEMRIPKTKAGIYHIEAETKWTPFSRRYFQMRVLVYFNTLTEIPK